jgi:hypothetical protein
MLLFDQASVHPTLMSLPLTRRKSLNLRSL